MGDDTSTAYGESETKDGAAAKPSAGKTYPPAAATSTTKKARAKSAKSDPITQADRLQIFQQAARDCQEAGLDIRYWNDEASGTKVLIVAIVDAQADSAGNFFIAKSEGQT